MSSSDPPAVRVFVNPDAGSGRGRMRWSLVEPELRRRLGDLEVEETVELGKLSTRLAELVGRGERRFVAAGGDGTVHLLLNAIMEIPESVSSAAEAAGDRIILGAVGLGSSNDYHKPFDKSTAVEGVPARVDFDGARERDVLSIEYVAPEGRTVTRYSLINASIGVTAEANARFNDAGRVVRAAQAVSVDAAIAVSALSTIVSWRDVTCAISTDGAEPEMISVTNLGVFKTPHFGGVLCYDTSVSPDDGLLGVALCEGMSTLETVSTLAALGRHRFKGRRKTRTWRARDISVQGDRVFALEMDGEVVRARSARFSVSPKRVSCC